MLATGKYPADPARSQGATSLAVCAVHSAQAMSSPGVCRRPDRLSHIESRCAGHARSATRAHQLPRLSGGSARQWLQCASTGGSVLACANVSECRPAAPGAVGFVLKASLAVEVRSLWSRDHVREGPGRWTAMDARHWSGLMCLETQGTRGGGPALVLDGVAAGLIHNQLGSTHVSDSEVPRSTCRWRRSASRCIPDGRSGRNVGMGNGTADMPEVRREGRRPEPQKHGAERRSGRCAWLVPPERHDSIFDTVVRT